MKYFYIIFASLFIIAGCGKSQLELDKERIRKEADELKKKIDSTQQQVNQEKKSLDSLKNKINGTDDIHKPRKLGEDAVMKQELQKPDAVEPSK